MVDDNRAAGVLRAGGRYSLSEGGAESRADAYIGSPLLRLNLTFH